jgi:hypothetical protein
MALHQIELLNAWVRAQPGLDYDFFFRDSAVATNSKDAPAIQATLTEKMKECSHILVVIGEKTFSDNWVTWEIDAAKNSTDKLKFAAVKIDPTFSEPGGLPVPATSFAFGFTLENIVNALNQARNRY